MASKSNYLPNVKEQYEDLPYPPRNPEDEVKQLFRTDLDHLPTINHMCFAGKWNYSKGARVLIAGGGTGDSTIYLAEQLRGTNSEIVHIDLSKASITIAKKRAKIRNLNNILFIKGSLLDVASMNIGKFDYINCIGVLHHLEDPDAGLKALKSILNPQGCMGIMVYAKYGRTAIYQTQELMQIINKNTEERQSKTLNLKETLKFMHPHHWLKFGQQVKPTRDDKGAYGDSGLYDLYLHEQDRAYTIPQLYDWIEENNLHIPDIPGSLGEQSLYLPESYIKDPALLKTIKKLPLRDQFAIGELMYGHIIKHTFYITKNINTTATLDDDDLIPTWDTEAAINARSSVIENNMDIVPCKIFKANFSIQTTPINVALFTHMDGIKNLGEVYEETIKTLSNQGEKINKIELKEKTQYLLTTLRQIGAFSLRDSSIPPQILSSELQARAFQK